MAHGFRLTHAVFQVDVLERDVFDVLYLIRSWRNTFAPINKIPPEILSLLPDFSDSNHRDRNAIKLTHVCRAWREVFVSRSSLWTDLDCADEEQTWTYLGRSKSSPINLSLRRNEGVFPYNPFVRIIPHTIVRLKSLFLEGTPEDVEATTAHLSHPTPLLEHLSIRAGHRNWLDPNPTLAPTLFDGELSSLRTLSLEFIHTKLPWRNMVNLTSFTLGHMLPGEVTIEQLLDFFESTPHLCKVNLHSITPAGTQHGRLVSLPCLTSMHIDSDDPPSILLDHLVIPVGTELTTRAPLLNFLVGEHLPRSLDNLKNLSNFTTIQLYFGVGYPCMRFSGPNGEVNTTVITFPANPTGLVLKSLGQLNTSKTKWLELNCSNPPNRNYLYQALLPMNNLHTLMLSQCRHLYIFIHALDPSMSPSEVVVCPKLEELILMFRTDEEILDITSVVGMAAARASRGAKLRTIRIVDELGEVDLDVLELRKHVWNVECGPGVNVS